MRNERCVKCGQTNKLLDSKGCCVYKLGCSRSSAWTTRMQLQGREVADMHKAGMSFGEIAKVLGCSRQRVHVILKRYQERWA